MSLRESLRVHPWRWFGAVVVALAVILLLVAFLFVRSLLQAQRFTQFLQQQLAGAGLVLTVDTPAAPTLWPHPAVQLQGFQVSSIGSTAPLLTASEARIVVPWRALLHHELAIERLEIESPRIDLDQLQALLARLPHSQDAPQLPRIGTGIRIIDGMLVRNEEPLLFGVDAETGTLLPDVPFHLTASAHTGGDRSGTLAVTALPGHEQGALRFDKIRLQVDIQRGAHADLAGNALWRGGGDVTADLRGSLKLPDAEPAASTRGAIPTEPRDYALVLQIRPAKSATPLTALLKLDRAGEHVDARIAPLALMDWWRSVLAATPGSALALPPLEGQAQIDNAAYGPVRVQGLRIDAGPKVAPLPAGSSPAPASTAPRKEVAH